MTARLSLLLALVGTALLVGAAPDASAQTATPNIVATPLERAPVLSVVVHGSCTFDPSNLIVDASDYIGCSAPGAQPNDTVLVSKRENSNGANERNLIISSAFVPIVDKIQFRLTNTNSTSAINGQPNTVDFWVMR